MNMDYSELLSAGSLPLPRLHGFMCAAEERERERETLRKTYPRLLTSDRH